MLKNKKEKVLIGKVVNVVGLKGELKIYNYSDSLDIYKNTKSLYIGDELRRVQSVRSQKNMVVLKVEGIDDRDGAERARNLEVSVTEADLPKLPKGQFYVRDLIGMEVVHGEGSTGKQGERLGVISDVIQNTAQDIFEVAKDDGTKVLIPRVPQFVVDIDAKSETVTVCLIEGIE